MSVRSAKPPRDAPVIDPGGLLVRPIGIVRSAFRDKVDAPRQGVSGGGEAVLSILPAFTQALHDLDGFERVWLIFWFHLARSANLMVLPPRSTRKRGLFATRSPHRPNPLGLTAAKLLRREGTTLFLGECDLVDGTPVLDLKPYVAYADAFPEARAGWLEEEGVALGAAPGPLLPREPRDPVPPWQVEFSLEAARQLAWLEERGVKLREPLERQLALGPQPHPYRRIRADGTAFRIAIKEWRARFTVAGRRMLVERVLSGYRPEELKSRAGEALDLHRAFTVAFV